MILGQSLLVSGVVEHPPALHLSVPRIIRPKALKRGPPDYCRVRPPVSSRQLAEPVCTCADASVNNRNQVTVGNQIQHIASPGPVHTREEHVAIERRAISLLFINRRHHWRGAKVRRSGALAQEFSENLNLKTANVTGDGEIKAV